MSQTEDDNSWTVEAAIPLAAFNFDSGAQPVSANSLNEIDSDFTKPWLIKLNRRINDADLWSDKTLPADHQRSMWDLLQADVDAKVFVME